MAVKKSGVKLVAEDYSTYMKQLKSVNEINSKAFSPSHLSKYNAASQKVVQSSKKIQNSMNKAEKEAKELQQALAYLGQSGKFSISKIDAETLRLKKSLELVKRSGKFDIKPPDPTGWGRAAVGVKTFGLAVKSVLGPIALLATAISAAMKIIEFGKASVEVAARNETLRVSLVTMANAYEITTEQVDYATAQLKKQGITTSAAQQSLMRMARANISWSEASKLAAIAQGSAVAAGMDSSQAFNRLILGIQKMEPELLDELGITLQRSVAYDKFAKTLGKNAKQLTDQEKKQAILNEVYAQSEPILGVYGAAMDTASKQQGSLVRKIEETQNSLGQMLLPLKTVSIELKTEFWEGAQIAAKGLALWGPIIAQSISGLKQLRYEAGLPLDVKDSYDEMRTILREIGVENTQAQSMIRGIISDIQKGTSSSDIIEDLKKQFIALGLSEKEAGDRAFEMANEFIRASDTIQSLEFESVWEKMGRGSQIWARTFVESIALVLSMIYAVKVALEATAKNISSVMSKTAEATNLLTGGDFSGAKKAYDELKSQAKDFGKDFSDEFRASTMRSFKANIEDLKAKFPLLYTAWDDLGYVAETNLDTINDGIEDVNVALEKMKAALEAEIDTEKARLDALKKVEQIQKNFNKQMEQENKRHIEAMAAEDKRYAKAKADEIKNFNKSMADAAKKYDQDVQKLEKDAAVTRKQMIEDSNRKQYQEQKKLHFDLEQERKRFELAQLQATRRFKVQDRRLRSEGDILALMDLREDFKLQQQENKENFDLGQTEQKSNLTQAQQAQKDELRANLQRLREETDARREELSQAYLQETEDLKAAHAEKMMEIESQHTERMEELIQHHEERKAEIAAARDEELAALGEAMQEEGKITKEGMEQIAEEIGVIFGDEGAGDALIKGWAERSNSAIANMVDETKAKIAELEEALKNAESAVANMGGTAHDTIVMPRSGTAHDTIPSPSQSSPGGQYHYSGGSYNMRQGGVGLVTGPATFNVEPGQREAVMFAPLPAMQNKLDVNMSGGFDIKGGEQAGKASVEAALDTMTEEFIMAIHKMGRRGTR